MKVPVKSRNDINLIKSELIENIIFDVPKDNCKEEKKLNSIEGIFF